MATRRSGADIYISVTAPNGDQINFHRTFATDDGLWTGGKSMLHEALDALLGPAVVAEDMCREMYREEAGF